MGDSFTGKWLRTNQYTIEGKEFFQLPEPEWQIRAKAAVSDKSSILQSLMLDNTVEGTSPFPGAAAWNGYAMAIGGYTDTADFDQEPHINLTIGSAPANGGLLKGI